MKQRGQDEEFQHEEDVEDPFQCFVYWNSLPTYDTYINDEDLIEVSWVFRKLIILIFLGLKIFNLEKIYKE
jgi:hypothetical protein